MEPRLVYVVERKAETANYWGEYTVFESLEAVEDYINDGGSEVIGLPAYAVDLNKFPKLKVKQSVVSIS